MPATLEAYHLTDQYRSDLLALRTRTLQAAGAAWAQLRLEDLDASFARWLQIATALTSSSGRQAVASTSDFLAQYIAAELHTDKASVPAADLGRADVARDGRPLAQALEPAIYTVKAELALKQPPPVALRAGLTRANRQISSELMATARDTLDTIGQQETRIIGWRRATTGSPCGACLAAAQKGLQPMSAPLFAHPHDRCVKEVVIEGVTERYRHPTGQELWDRMTEQQQNQLFHGRGGKAKADLIRSGDVPLERLLTTQPMATVPDEITETPLAALKVQAKQE